MKAQVVVKLKSAVLDPQGLAIQKSLHAMGYDGVSSCRVGKVFNIELNVADEKTAREMLREVSEKLLANTVIEDFEIKIL